MITYTVTYQLKTGKTYRVEDIKGDFYDLKNMIKVLVFDDESQIHINMEEITYLRYSKERFFSIKESAEVEAGQAIPIRR